MNYFDSLSRKNFLFFSPYVEDAASASFNDLENQPDISPAAGNMGSPSKGFWNIIRFDLVIFVYANIQVNGVDFKDILFQV